MLTELASLPREVERIDGDTVPPQPRTRIEGHESKRLGLRSLDHLPDIDPHGFVDQLQFVHQRDVDGTKDVLQEFRRLGDPAR